MAKYVVQSMVIIETVIELPDDQEQVYEYAGDEASNIIHEALTKAGLDFDFDDEYLVYDMDGNEIL